MQIICLYLFSDRSGVALATAVLIIIASLVEVLTRKRETADDVEIQNNNNNAEDLKSYDVSGRNHKRDIKTKKNGQGSIQILIIINVLIKLRNFIF